MGYFTHVTTLAEVKEQVRILLIYMGYFTHVTTLAEVKEQVRIL